MGSIQDLFINSTFNASNFVQFDQFHICPPLDSSNRSNELRKQIEDNISLMIKHDTTNKELKYHKHMDAIHDLRS